MNEQFLHPQGEISPLIVCFAMSPWLLFFGSLYIHRIAVTFFHLFSTTWFSVAKFIIDVWMFMKVFVVPSASVSNSGKI